MSANEKLTALLLIIVDMGIAFMFGNGLATHNVSVLVFSIYLGIIAIIVTIVALYTVEGK